MEEPGRNRLFLIQYTCLLTAVTHGRARKEQIIPKPIHMSTYTVTHGRAREKHIIPKPIHMSTYRCYTWKSQAETDYS